MRTGTFTVEICTENGLRRGEAERIRLDQQRDDLSPMRTYLSRQGRRQGARGMPAADPLPDQVHPDPLLVERKQNRNGAHCPTASRPRVPAAMRTQTAGWGTPASCGAEEE